MARVRVIFGFGGSVGFREFRDLGAAVSFVLRWRASWQLKAAEVGVVLLGARAVRGIGNDL